MLLKPFNPDKDLKKINRRYTKKQLLTTLMVLFVMITIGSSYAIFSIQPEYHTFLKSQVGEFSTGDIKLSVQVDGKAAEEFPKKDSGYTLEYLNCTNDSSYIWDEDNWELKISIKGPDECVASFGLTLATEIENLAPTNLSTMSNDDPDGNVRYIGKSPNNYVKFNNELWRIVGVFNIKGEDNNYKKRVKIVRNDSIGSLSWDTTPTTQINTDGKGINAWFQADVMSLLNLGHYWNRTSGVCYNGINNATTSCNYTTTGLLEASKNLISKVEWNTGSITAYDTTSNGLPNHFYTNERGDIVNTTSSDGVIREKTWVGIVGLLYPSDYGYATSGGTSVSRQTCLNYVINIWNDPGYTECGTNNYLYDLNEDVWTLTVSATGKWNVFAISSDGRIGAFNAYRNKAVKPAVYLNSDVLLLDGEGTSTNPYIVGYKK